MKVFFYIWCLMAMVGLVATFFNPSHIVTCTISALMAYAAYPEVKQEQENQDE